MSDEATATATQVTKKRRGRPPKKRHDPDPAPIDGNRAFDKVQNKEAGYEYMLVSDEDMQEMKFRGAVICERDSESAKLLYDDREKAGEAHIGFRELTLMKIRVEDAERARAPGFARAKQRMAAMRKEPMRGNNQYANVSEFEGGFSRSVI